jgi:hypothetical protein
MILHRMGRAIAEQNWFIVIIELLVVVVGILLGLQIDDWNRARQDRMDEGQFLERMHEDVLLAEELSHRLRQRKLDRLDWMLDASDVLFNRINRDALTDEECTAIAWSTAFNFVAAGLPSVDELIGTGRLGIIRDADLRAALVALRQTRLALAATISEKSTSSNFNYLPTAFPDLFQLTPYVDDSIGEVGNRMECDLASMRTNRPFLNQFGTNVDGYDAYIRDGVKPWSLQLERVHELVDNALNIDHVADENE